MTLHFWNILFFTLIHFLDTQIYFFVIVFDSNYWKLAKRSARFSKRNSVTITFVFRNRVSCCLDTDVCTFSWLPYSTLKHFGNPKTFPKSCVTCTSHKGTTSAEKKREDCDKIFFSATSFHRFYVHLLKVFSHQITDQANADSPSVFLPGQPQLMPNK